MANQITGASIAAARAAGAQDRAAGLAALSVRYDSNTRRFLIELSNGILFGLPVASLPHIAGAADRDLEQVELLGESILQIPSLDADYSIPALVTTYVGQTNAARMLGRSGGSAKSTAKAEAARRNGAKGGRPVGKGRAVAASALSQVREPTASPAYFTGKKPKKKRSPRA